MIVELDDWFEVEKSIKVAGSIKANKKIKAGWGIEAGLSITAKFLDIGLRIFAGLKLNRKPSEKEMQINVEEIKQGEVCFGKLNITKPAVKKMTIEEISKALGYEVEITTDNSNDNDFKVGDKVIGLPSASEMYNVTNEGYEGVITKIITKEKIELDDRWSVCKKYFKKI